MNTLSYRTQTPKADQITKEWLLVDAENEVVGRLATKVAALLRGKYKTNFSPHIDCGDNVIVINAEKVRFTGSKMSDKEYVHYSGYPGGQTLAAVFLRRTASVPSCSVTFVCLQAVNMNTKPRNPD